MEYLYIGKIVNTHGIKGEVRILSKFRYKEKVFKKGNFIYIGKNKDQECILSYRVHKQFDMIVMDGYTNINEVLKYKGKNVYINRDDLVLGEGEYLDEDLIGLDVFMDDVLIGSLERIERMPYQDKIVVNKDGKEYLVPYVCDIIKTINLKDRIMVLEKIDGLFEDWGRKSED